MLKKNISKILIIAFVAFVCAIAKPTEALSAKDPIYHRGYFMFGGTKYHGELVINPDGSAYWLAVNQRTGRISEMIYCGPCPGLKILGKTNFAINDVLSEISFNLSVADNFNLQVLSSVDAKCDIYELGTGKLLLKDIVVGNNSYQPVPVKPSNTPYLIQFKVDGNVVSQQTFIFNSSNHLSIGGKNE